MPLKDRTQTKKSVLDVLLALRAGDNGEGRVVIKESFGLNHSTFYRWRAVYAEDAKRFDALLKHVAEHGIPKEPVTQWPF